MSYLIYEKTGKKDMATTSLQKISDLAGNYPRPTDLVSAWAMEKREEKGKAVQSLDQMIQKYPGNKILLWTKSMFLDQPTDLLPANEKNAAIRVLEQLNELH